MARKGRKGSPRRRLEGGRRKAEEDTERAGTGTNGKKCANAGARLDCIRGVLHVQYSTKMSLRATSRIEISSPILFRHTSLPSPDSNAYLTCLTSPARSDHHVTHQLRREENQPHLHHLRGRGENHRTGREAWSAQLAAPQGSACYRVGEAHPKEGPRRRRASKPRRALEQTERKKDPTPKNTKQVPCVVLHLDLDKSFARRPV